MENLTAAQPPPGIRLWHIAIPVADLPAALEFYCGKLGFNLVGESDGPTKHQAFVALESGCCLQLYQPRPATQASLRCKPDHIAFECGSAESCRAGLLERGMRASEIVEPEPGVRQFSIIDPDGVLLQFVEGRSVYEQALQGAGTLARQ